MPLDPMFLNLGGSDRGLIILAITATGMVVGFAWLRRAAGPDPDKEPSFWRYRKVGEVRRPLSFDRLPTPGWIATRLTMVVAAGTLGFVILAPGLLEAFGGAVSHAPWLWFVAIGLASVGTFWIFRIARADPDSESRFWRYRDF